MKFQKAIYQTSPEKHGNGMHYFTSCCRNQMFSIFDDEYKYHGKLCPKCFWNNIYTTLYLAGRDEAKEVKNYVKEISRITCKKE